MPIGGQDVRDVTQESLRRAIGMVTQETAMFNRSARDNIRYGRPDATDDEVDRRRQGRPRRTTSSSTLEDFKGRTGYDAHLGERGREALGRAAPAHRPRPRHPQGRADPGAGRGDLGARQRGRGRDPGRAGRGHGGQDRDRHRPPPVHHRADGPDRRAWTQGTHRRGGHARGAAGAGRALRALLEPAVGRLPRRWRPRRRSDAGRWPGSTRSVPSP